MSVEPSSAEPSSTERSTPTYVHALGLALDPAWRRLPDGERGATGRAFAEEVGRAPEDGVRTWTYSSIGLQPGVDVLLWSLGPSLAALEEAAARSLRAGIGQWMSVHDSFLGVLKPSQYVAKPTEQEQSEFGGERSRYLVVYPFRKSAEWYLLARETRQGIMNEHMRIGRQWADIRQLLAYSFGLDDDDFLVAYETDDLDRFGDLVRALRGTESRRSTVNDTPVLVAVHRPIGEILTLLGADA